MRNPPPPLLLALISFYCLEPGRMEDGPSRSFERDNGSEFFSNGHFDADLPTGTQSRSSLRLLVIQSPVLPPRRKIAVLDVHDEVQIGRDPSPSPKLRLKEMEVSKLHATVFWDTERDEWAVVDMGSKHGTFLTSFSSSIRTRLSASRASSLPRTLRHLDQLSFGRSTFAVHIHPEGVPCEDCSPPDELATIPLSSKVGSSLLRPQQVYAQPESSSVAEALASLKRSKAGSSQQQPAAAANTPASAKEALGSLKRRLLSEHRTAPDSKRSKANDDESRTRYVDRSSLRRALHPSARDPISLPVPAARPTSINPSSSTHARTVARYHMQDVQVQAPPSSAPAAIPKSNLGHRLLEKQGWSPGAPLGIVPSLLSSDLEVDPASVRKALLVPLQVSANVGKLGLGSSHPR